MTVEEFDLAEKFVGGVIGLTTGFAKESGNMSEEDFPAAKAKMEKLLEMITYFLREHTDKLADVSEMLSIFAELLELGVEILRLAEDEE